MRMVFVFSWLCCCSSPLTAQKIEPLEREKLRGEVDRLNQEGLQLYQRGKYADAIEQFKQALAINRQLYSEAEYPNGHQELARSVNAVGVLLHSQGDFEQALPYLEQSLAMKVKLYPESKFPNGHLDLANSTSNLGAVHHARGSVEKAVPYMKRSLELYRKLFPKDQHPDGHPALATAINNLGGLMLVQGAYESAGQYYEQALDMYRKLYPKSKFPDGHPDIAKCLNNVAMLLQTQGAYDRALPIFEEALAMDRSFYPEARFPNGHPALAGSLDNVGFLLREQRVYDKALPYLEQALAIRRKLYPETKYPNGHHELADSLRNLGFLLVEMGESVRGRSYCEQCLAMCRKLYPESRFPNGHPDLASSLTATIFQLYKAGEFEQMLPLSEEFLEINRKLYPKSKYPDGHVELARSLRGRANVLLAAGHYQTALPISVEALAMARRLFPLERYSDGHREVASCLNNLGILHKVQGNFGGALPYLEEALAMYNRMTRRVLLTASEADALAFVQLQPLARDSYLFVSGHLPNTAADAYRSVWISKAAVTRVLELRHSLARAADGGAVERLGRLRQVRKRVDQLLQDVRLPKIDRDTLLRELSDERDKLERELAADLPVFQQWDERDRVTPIELAKVLPAGSVFVDFLVHIRVDQDPNTPGKKGERHAQHYLAFLVSAGNQVRRIDLGPATTIDAAITSWRAAIERKRDVRGDNAAEASESLRKLIWEPIANQFPLGTKSLYFAPDGDLARIPWAALPIGNDRVLLEDYAVATVPHGPFLLEHLKFPRKFEGSGQLFAVGGLDYGSKWPALTGTKVELDAVASLVPAERETASQREATADRVAKGLSKARYAHIATHGEFRAEEFAAEKKRDFEVNKSWVEGQDMRGVAAKNPLGFVGLVLSGGEVMSGLSILDLNLDNLKLVTLSACETGLGEYTGGKGVENLQMAFHIAGAKNVVASLWKVNDAATAALMAKFYHELWVNKKPPIEALREAQLFIYFNPDKIPDVLGERGAPKRTEALAVKTTGTSPAAREGKRADTRLWAAFVLSGVGK